MAEGLLHKVRWLFVLDFEATCDDRNAPKPQEIIEFPTVIVDLETRTIESSQFSCFVRPVHHPTLTRFCTELTSIQQSDVDTASTFPEVFSNHWAWVCEQRLPLDQCALVTCGDWDLATMLPAQLKTSGITTVPAFYCRWLNVKNAFSSTSRKKKGMAGMLRDLGLKLEGRHHRGIDDCRNIARICVSLGAAAPWKWSELHLSHYPEIRVRVCLEGTEERSALEFLMKTRNWNKLVGTLCGLFGRSIESCTNVEDLTRVKPGDLLILKPRRAKSGKNRNNRVKV